MPTNQPETESTSRTTSTSRGDFEPLDDRCSDLIDDRVVETVEELLGESLDAAVAERLGRPRKRAWLLMAVLVAVVSGLSVALLARPGVLAVLWAAAAIICACQVYVCRPYGSAR